MKNNFNNSEPFVWPLSSRHMSRSEAAMVIRYIAMLLFTIRRIYGNWQVFGQVATCHI